MKIATFCVCFILGLSFFDGSAQTVVKRIHEREQLWLGYFNQSRLTNKFGLWLDVHYRRTDNFLDRPFQLLLRTGLTYFIRENLRINVGYALAEHFPPEGLNTTRTEHRPWQQIWWNQKYPGLTTIQSLRLEQRFHERIADDVKMDGYNYNFRLRYNFAFHIPLTGKEIASGRPFLAIVDEVFLNFGDRITYNTFDQNRFFAGMGYPLTAHMTAQFGYMNVYQQEPSGNNYRSTHTIRLFVYHSLDFRARDETK